jgi:hypothetical protein
MRLWLSPIVSVLVLACSGASSSTNDSAHPDAASDALSADSAPSGGSGVVGIYSSCAPERLGQTYSSAKGFTVDYPAAWTGDPQEEVYGFTTPYSYLPTGSTTPASTTAIVSVELDGPNLSDPKMRLQQIPEAYTGVVSRTFELQGHAALAFWYRSPPPQAGCSSCPVDPGPDLITIGVAAILGSEIVEMTGSARVDAPAAIFCDIQAIEGSLSF